MTMKNREKNTGEQNIERGKFLIHNQDICHLYKLFNYFDRKNIFLHFDEKKVSRMFYLIISVFFHECKIKRTLCQSFFQYKNFAKQM